MTWSRREALRIAESTLSWSLAASITASLAHACFVDRIRDIKFFPRFNLICVTFIYAGYFLYPKPEVQYYKRIPE